VGLKITPKQSLNKVLDKLLIEIIGDFNNKGFVEKKLEQLIKGRLKNLSDDLFILEFCKRLNH
jgi:hypothetical protein